MTTDRKIIEYHPPGPVVEAFHESDDFVRILTGPIGSGKTTACVMEILFRALSATPCTDGVRRSRWAVIRSTYPELKSTTIKSWQQWVPESVFGKIRWSSPITHSIWLAPDCHLEVLFLAVESDADIKKLLSLELTGLYVNELGVGLPRNAFDAAVSRLRRFPSRQMLGDRRTWFGAIADTNAPGADHWLWELRDTCPEGFGFFDQPPAVFRAPDGKWRLNDKAENLENLDPDYYRSLLAGKRDDWVRRFLACERVFLSDDKAVFADDFSSSIHVAPSPGLSPIRTRNLIIGMDYGLTPAAVIGQVDSRGRIRILDEVVGDNIGVRQFVETILLPFLDQMYPKYQFYIVGDPAGSARSGVDEKTVFGVLRELGLTAFPAPTNRILERIEAVRWFFNRVVGGEPAIRINQRCQHLLAALGSGYRYRKVRTVGDEVRYHLVPAKDKHSHVCFVEGTLVDGKPIEQYNPGDLVCTPVGKRRVVVTGGRIAPTIALELSNGVIIRCTPDHPFWTVDGFVPARDLQLGECLADGGLLWKFHWKLNHRLKKVNTRFSSSGGLGTTRSHRGTINAITDLLTGRWISIFIELYGSQILVRFRKAFTYTIKTATRIITHQRIYSFWARGNTYRYICQNPMSEKGQLDGLFFMRFLPLQNGEKRIQRKQERWLGKLARKGGRLLGLARRLYSFVNIAGRSLKRFLLAGHVRSSVLLNAARRIVGVLESITLHLCVKIVGKALRVINTVKRNFAPKSVSSVIGMELGQPQKVVNLKVEDASCFYAEGVLVSNCDALQYLCVKVRHDTELAAKKPPRQNTMPVDPVVGV